jgi:SAM-dependent methyltransferase
MQFESVVFFGRTGEEALAMFELDPADWAGSSVLDCPGGPGSLAALLHGAGILVTAADPLYVLDNRDLELRARADLEQAMVQMAANPDFRPDFDLEHCRALRMQAIEQFLADRACHPHSYRAASLPALPFETASFDLVLSGHLLFSYAPRRDGGLMAEGGFDLAWHRTALAELLRVSRREVRLYPAHTLQGVGVCHPYAEALLQELPAAWQGTFTCPDYDQGHTGCTDGLRLWRG